MDLRPAPISQHKGLLTALAMLMCLTSYMPVQAQFGGQQSFQFLNLPVTAKSAALGGVLVTSPEADVQLFAHNPALIDSSLHHHAGLSYQSLVADIGYGSFSYVRNLGTVGTWGASIQFLDYGEFQGFDAAGTPTGSFNGSDIAFSISHARPLGPIKMGGSLKVVHSTIGGLQASALLMDIGGVFEWTESLQLGLVFKNFGVVLSDYTDTGDAEIPFDVQLGLTFKPQYMPFRFTLTGYNLGLVNETLLDPNGTGLGEPQDLGTADRIFRHLAIGTEILISPNFNLRAGYNHLRRQELRLAETSGGAGFSFGFLMRIKRFELAYTRALYHVAGGYNYFTLTSNLNSYIKRKN